MPGPPLGPRGLAIAAVLFAAFTVFFALEGDWPIAVVTLALSGVYITALVGGGD